MFHCEFFFFKILLASKPISSHKAKQIDFKETQQLIQSKYACSTYYLVLTFHHITRGIMRATIAVEY